MLKVLQLIVGRECKILMVEFFSSLVLVQSLYEVLGCNRYVDTPTGSINLLSMSIDHLSYRQSPVYRPP